MRLAPGGSCEEPGRLVQIAARRFGKGGRPAIPPARSHARQSVRWSSSPGQSGRGVWSFIVWSRVATLRTPRVPALGRIRERKERTRTPRGMRFRHAQTRWAFGAKRPSSIPLAYKRRGISYGLRRDTPSPSHAPAYVGHVHGSSCLRGSVMMRQSPGHAESFKNKGSEEGKKKKIPLRRCAAGLSAASPGGSTPRREWRQSDGRSGSRRALWKPSRSAQAIHCASIASVPRVCWCCGSACHVRWKTERVAG